MEKSITGRPASRRSVALWRTVAIGYFPSSASTGFNSIATTVVALTRAANSGLETGATVLGSPEFRNG
jgi:hypothetical protein